MDEVKAVIETADAGNVAAWNQSVSILVELLKKATDGVVSSQALRKELENSGIQEVREIVARLKAVDFESADAPPVMMRWYHFGRSFLTQKAYLEAQRSQEAEAEKAEELAVEDESLGESEEGIEEAPTPEKRKRRAEERRMGTYIIPVLEELYDTDYSPDNYVFDVHSGRSGEEFENIDLLAVHWRSELTIDLISVEIKLKFLPALVQQALNYCRFSDRVWIAVPVKATTARDAAAELRAASPLLFDHVVETGLGILVCHRGQGGAYDVFPIHWPRKTKIESLERERFIERYREQLELASVIAPRARKAYPLG